MVGRLRCRQCEIDQRFDTLVSISAEAPKKPDVRSPLPDAVGANNSSDEACKCAKVPDLKFHDLWRYRWAKSRTQLGELLWPDRFGSDEIANLKVSLGSYGTAGQLQQRPSPAGGGIFKRHWCLGPPEACRHGWHG